MHKTCHAAFPFEPHRSPSAVVDCRTTIFSPWSQHGKAVSEAFGSGSTRFPHQGYHDGNGGSVLLRTHKIKANPSATPGKKKLVAGGMDKWSEPKQLRDLGRMTSHERPPGCRSSPISLPVRDTPVSPLAGRQSWPSFCRTKGKRS